MSSNNSNSFLSSLSQLSNNYTRALLLINTKTKNPAAIERSTKSDVTTVIHRHESATSKSIIDNIYKHLPNKNNKVTAIALLLHVSGSAAYIAGGESGLRLSYLDGEVEIQENAIQFFTNLIKNYMQDPPISNIQPRIDFFILDIVQNSKEIIKKLEQIVNLRLKNLAKSEKSSNSGSNSSSHDANSGSKNRNWPLDVQFFCNVNAGEILTETQMEAFLTPIHPVHGNMGNLNLISSQSISSKNSSSSEKNGRRKIDYSKTVAAIYFKPEKLRTLAQSFLSRSNIQTLSSMDAYEKVKKVGQGAFGKAVLYTRKDDHSNVILKTINIGWGGKVAQNLVWLSN